MTDESKRKSRNAYLSVLPDNWHYGVQIVGPAEQVVRVGPTFNGDEHEIVTVTSDGTEHRTTAPTLDEAIRQAAKGVKALAAVAAQEAEAAKARADAVAALGTIVEDDEVPVDPAGLIDPATDQREAAGLRQ